ncbi:PEPxxWA-CTERM sorting domain-containing protein [Sandaracinobacteroides saxicola]|uniref:PEP-CTERM sorting domain-containing protein n=1 Tax=Sandaracinobacteroides saxicola TaxID=2759707 RepID=A0A7G5IHA7_9SPHN|nr:PEPxxWA-CTERM sorting domain-containing protein [Sandaracinobacteroides saxicola]QMW22749.1 PEP-CTERM sorting domain-containing protein [Sandaracinobacteroides saxicola]
MKLRLFAAVAAACLAIPASAATLLGPSPYLSFADSPFNGGTFSLFTLQTFDNQGLDTSEVTASAGSWLNFGTLIDSVGGNGSTPGSWYSNGSYSVTFSFANYAALHGALPTHAGIVWTDLGFSDGECCGSFAGVGPVRFSAVDGLGNALGTLSATVGDGVANGTTAEDRFFGVINPGGIGSITITMPFSTDWEVDHLQYGSMVPEPATWAMLIAGFGLVGGTLRRRRAAIA